MTIGKEQMDNRVIEIYIGIIFALIKTSG